MHNACSRLTTSAPTSDVPSAYLATRLRLVYLRMLPYHLLAALAASDHVDWLTDDRRILLGNPCA
jgi:hypothetical protein